MRKLNQDAAYALGEEAFRAGFKAALELALNQHNQRAWTQQEDQAWADYEPSETVKELIGC
jgi:hypothetical protein